MDILKFKNFISESVQIPVVDIVIDSNGNVYNGVLNPLIKGNVDIKKVNSVNQIVDIIGDDKNSYIAGIDKNGKIVPTYNNVLDNYLIDNNGNPILIPNDIKSLLKIKGNKWDLDFDYSSLLSTVPTGWVNTKIDMEIIKRVRRYATNLGNLRGDSHSIFLSKLEDLNSLNLIKHRKRNVQNVQREMSMIMLLHYIDEIKGFFTSSSSGFLFESFMGGLLKNAKIVSDNGNADITSDGKEYQVKSHDVHNSPSVQLIMNKVDVNVGGRIVSENKFLDHYILCFKRADRVEVFVLDGDSSSSLYCDNFTISTDVTTLKSGKIYKNTSYSQLTKKGAKSYLFDLLSIDEKIDKISKGLKEVLNSLYEELSVFQYNVETIVSGTNKDGKVINGDEFTVYSELARRNAEKMKNELENLISHYKREPKV